MDVARQATKAAPVITKDYDIKGLIRKGHKGEVRECIHKKTKFKRAVKIFSRKNLPAKIALQQIDVLKTLDHPNVLKFHEAYKDQKRLYMVTELCSGGELFDVIIKRGRSFNEKEASRYMH